MAASSASSLPPASRAQVAAYGHGARAVAALALVVSRASVPGMLIAIVGFHVPSLPLTVLRWTALYVLLPGAVGVALSRAARATVTLTDAGVRVARDDVQVDVAWSALAAVEPWRVPLPCAGVDLRLASGRRLAWGLAAADPSPLLDALAARGVVGARDATRHLSIRWAHARAAYVPRGWRSVLVRYPLFGLLLSLPVFNVHQWIAYGGTFGQYYTYGLVAYLETFALYWSTVTVYLLSWAGCWRGLGEAVCAAAAAVAPAQTVRVRRLTERAIDVGYYLGAVAVLAARFAS